MPSHRVVVFVSLTALFAFAGCPGDPGVITPYPDSPATSSSSGMGTTSSSSSGGAGGSGGSPCACAAPLACCGDACVDLATDIFNCGECGNVCPGPTPFCNQGQCSDPCPSGFGCEEGLCCGEACCDDTAGQICCNVAQTSGELAPTCVMAQNGTCPITDN